ncbi:hypothetical protein [Adlercreutzia caecimuris]|uniref:hypothetical protein n=1 Tax=Adlercreutzia caecimuris TaxID=671266 RepID=UPI00272A27FB|nr:hypothetical protein [Adlercreutzia caecimuris]
MAKDDYQVIAYKVLVRLYVCLKARFGGLFHVLKETLDYVPEHKLYYGHEHSKEVNKMVYPSKQRYDKRALVKASVSFNRNIEPELASFIEGMENKAAYLKALVREDYERRKKG